MQKKHFFLLCFLLLLLSACQSSKKSTHQEAHTVAQPVKVADEEVYYPEKPTNDASSGSPSQGDSKAEDADNTTSTDSQEEFIDDREIELTPESELYFFNILKKDYKNRTFHKYQSPWCVEALTKGTPNVEARSLFPCYLTSEIHLIVRVKEQVLYPYCHRGRYLKYNNHILVRAEVLYSFSKDFNEKTIEMIFPASRKTLDTVEERVLPSEEEIFLVGVDKTKYNDYFANFEFKLQLQPKPIPKMPEPPRIRRPSHITTCRLLDIPSKIKELEKFFIHLANGKSRIGPVCPEKYYAPRRKERIERNYQSHGIPGKKCSIAGEERKAEEAYLKFEREQAKYDEAFNVGGKKIPCADCPSGYMIQDLSIEEYTEKVNKNLDKLEKNKK